MACKYRSAEFPGPKGNTTSGHRAERMSPLLTFLSQITHLSHPGPADSEMSGECCAAFELTGGQHADPHRRQEGRAGVRQASLWMGIAGSTQSVFDGDC